MQEIKNQIEAVLFTTGKFMTVEEIAKLCGVGSVGVVRDALIELREDYLKRESSLEIFEEKGNYKLNIKKKYSYLTTKLLNDSELDTPTQETLAIIAYKQPVLQSEVIKIRGTTAYDHVKTLREGGFITSEKSGRTRLLKLTPKFFDYFDVVEDHLQSKFKEIETKVSSEDEVQKELSDEKEIKEEHKVKRKKKKKPALNRIKEEINELSGIDNEESGTANIPEGSISFD